MNGDYSRKISERMWNQPDKGELESRREETFIDDIIQKDHLERQVLEALEGVETVFDGGAGSGRFSILMAKLGRHVTHFDISAPMIEKAKELAAKAGVLDRMDFVQGPLEDLGAYRDGQFDMAVSFDAPVSYTYPHQERVIAELSRICSKRLLLSVSSRLGSLPYLCNPLNKNQFILDEGCDDPWVQGIIKNKDAMVENFRFNLAAVRKVLAGGLLGGQEEIDEYERGGAPWCITYCFMPDELRGIMERCGLKDIRLAGPGAYSRTIPHEILQKLMRDPEQKRDFLDFCYEYDRQPYAAGVGKDNLFARGEK